MTVEAHGKPEIHGMEHVAVYASSDWAERGFCRQCGSHLFYHLKQGDFYALPVGLFEGSGSWKFTKQIFIDEKPRNYQFADKTELMTGQDVFDQFTGDSQ